MSVPSRVTPFIRPLADQEMEDPDNPSLDASLFDHAPTEDDLREFRRFMHKDEAYA